MAISFTRQEPILNLGGAWMYIFNVDFDSVTGGKISTGYRKLLANLA